MMAAVDSDIIELRREVKHRLETYPSASGHLRFVAVLIAVFDLEFGGAAASNSAAAALASGLSRQRPTGGCSDERQRTDAAS